MLDLNDFDFESFFDYIISIESDAIEHSGQNKFSMLANKVDYWLWNKSDIDISNVHQHEIYDFRDKLVYILMDLE